VQPFVDGDDLDDGFVSDGEFVVSGRHSAVAFEPVDSALDSVALLVDVGSKDGGPPPLDPLARRLAS
jgi:hypothetical protein